MYILHIFKYTLRMLFLAVSYNLVSYYTALHFISQIANIFALEFIKNMFDIIKI